MGITTSLILIAAGAIMRFAVTAQASGEAKAAVAGSQTTARSRST